MIPITPLRKYCHNCNNWEWEPTIYLPDGSSAYPGHCAIISVKCINAVADGHPLPPPDFANMKDTDYERHTDSV